MTRRIVVMSGQGMSNAAAIAAMLRCVVPDGLEIEMRDVSTGTQAKPKAPATEREIWNAAVDKRKAEKQSTKATK